MFSMSQLLSDGDGSIPPPPILPEYLTVTEVAERLKVTAPYIRSEVRSGRLHALRVGKLIRLTPNDVRAWLGEASK